MYERWGSHAEEPSAKSLRRWRRIGESWGRRVGGYWGREPVMRAERRGWMRVWAMASGIEELIVAAEIGYQM